MRKAALALGLVVVAGVVGLLQVKPSLAIVVGLALVIGVVTFFGVRTDRLAVFAVGLLALTITWNGLRLGASGNSSSPAGGGAFGDATLVLAFLAVMADVIGRKRPLAIPPWLLLAALGLVLAFVVTMIFPPSTEIIQRQALLSATIGQQSGAVGPVASLGLGADTLNLIEYLLALLVIPILITAVATTPRRCRLMMDLFTAGAIINGAFGVLDIGGIHLGPNPPYQNRSLGLTIHPNYLALTCVVALPMAMLWFGRSRRYTVAAVIGVLSLLGGVYASGSRAGFVAAGIGLVVTVCFVPRLRRSLQYVLPVVGGLLVAVLLFTSTGHKLLVQLRLAHSSTGTTTSGSNYQRSILAHTAWSTFKLRPISGIGWSVVTGAHDIYLELLESGGVIALAAFLTFIGGIVASIRNSLSGPLRDEAIVCGMAILAWLANGVFDNQVADKYLYFVPGLVVAIARTTWLLQSRRAPSMPPVAPRLPGTPSLRPGSVPARELAGIGARS
jgi:O-antigen ligase